MVAGDVAQSLRLAAQAWPVSRSMVAESGSNSNNIMKSSIGEKKNNRKIYVARKKRVILTRNIIEKA